VSKGAPCLCLVCSKQIKDLQVPSEGSQKCFVCTAVPLLMTLMLLVAARNADHRKQTTAIRSQEVPESSVTRITTNTERGANSEAA
jgi:hypothetical protein